jgi:hypothetical protein
MNSENIMWNFLGKCHEHISTQSYFKTLHKCFLEKKCTYLDKKKKTQCFLSISKNYNNQTKIAHLCTENKAFEVNVCVYSISCTSK